MAKNSAQAPTEKPEAQKGSGAAKMPLFSTKFDGSGSDNTDEFRRTLSGHLELLGVAKSQAQREATARRAEAACFGDDARREAAARLGVVNTQWCEQWRGQWCE